MIKLLVFLILVSQFVFTQTAKDLIGSWQAVPYVAAGYDETYTFNEDGTFTFHYNQMDCAKREIMYGGDWEFYDKKIKLYVTYNEYYKFGWFEKSTGSCASDSMLIGGIKTTHYFVPFEIIELAYTDWSVVAVDGLERKMIWFNEIRYWHFSKFDYGK